MFLLLANPYHHLYFCEKVFNRKFTNPREIYFNQKERKNCILKIFQSIEMTSLVPEYSFLKNFEEDLLKLFKKKPELFKTNYYDLQKKYDQSLINKKAQDLLKQEASYEKILKLKPTELKLRPVLTTLLRKKNYSLLKIYLEKLKFLDPSYSDDFFLSYYLPYKEGKIEEAKKILTSKKLESSRDLFWAFYLTKDSFYQEELLNKHLFSSYTVFSLALSPKEFFLNSLPVKNRLNKAFYKESLKYCHQNEEQCLYELKYLVFNGEDPLTVASYFSKKEYHLPVFQFLSPQINFFSKNFLKILFPKKYFSLIKKHSPIDPYLVLSQIRQESAFNEKAVSSARALGLMQVLESTAKALNPKVKSLFDPKENIKTGLIYLKDLLDKYSYLLSLASYNAGPNIVNKWLSEGLSTHNAFDLIEEIPYLETSLYLKLILRNYFFYKILNEEDPYPTLQEVLNIESKMTDISVLN